jgi:hypothetical protein
MLVRVQSDLSTVATLWEQVLKADAPRDSGDLAASISVDGPNQNGERFHLTARAESEYAEYVDQGTGVFGPTGRPIKGKPLLVFYWPRVGKTMFLREVQGQPAQEFWEKPMRERVQRVFRAVFS